MVANPDTNIAVAKSKNTIFYRLKKDKLALGGVVFLLLIFATAIFAPLIAPFDPLDQTLSWRLKAPTTEAGGPYLGSDSLGRDILSRLIYGSRVTLIVGFSAVIISGAIGITMGVLAGYYGGRLDGVVSWLINTLLAFPFILLALVFAALFGRGLGNIILVLGLTGWVQYARVARNSVYAVKSLEYVQSAQSIGATHLRIMFRHILPNILPPLIVIASYELARMIIMEAALSFLGLGVSPTTPSWGTMLADGREYLTTAWWIVLFPGLAITATVACVNIVGDWLRDELDPRLKNLK